MATARGFLSEEQFLCSICLDVFTEPVTIPCGHNFCKACISRHWKGKEQCQCPMCNEKFNKGLKLNVNTGFKDIVQDFKKHQTLVKKSTPLKPGEVPCDCCQGIKFKALKTCLVCLASFCETHLQPHQREAVLMNHKLTDPVKNLADKICKKHNRMLELFCRDDLILFCDLCREHREHNTAPLEEEFEQRKAELERKKSEVKEMIQERQKKVGEVREAAESKKRDCDEALERSTQTFALLVASANIRLKKLLQVIEEKQKAVDRQAEILAKELKKEVTELQKRSVKLEQISHIQDHLQLIHSFESFSSSTSHTKSWSDISNHSHYFEEAVATALVQLEETLTKEMVQAGKDFWGCCKEILAEETETVEKPFTDLDTVPEGMKLEIIRRQYEVDMTFDPRTASDMLLFSDDMKQVRTSYIWWINNEPHKFSRYAYILGKKGFSKGRFYYEVQVERKTGWDLGVIRESVCGNQTFTLNSRNGAWIIRLRNNTNFRVLHSTPIQLSLKRKPERIGVFVDYEKGLVSFYDVATAALIYSFTGCTFNEKIFPFFSPCPCDGGINDAPLVLSSLSYAKNGKQKKQEATTLIKKTKPWGQISEDVYWLLIIIVIAVTMFIGKS